MTDKIAVLVTCPNEREAARLARILVERRLAACVNIHRNPVRSIYRWQGKIEEANEHLLVIKSTRRRFAALREAITRAHSYQVPEIIALPIVGGSPKYLRWVAESVASTPQKARRR